MPDNALQNELNKVEQNLERQCRDCAGFMKPTARENENWEGPGAKQGLRFVCTQCGEDIWIADTSTISSTVFSGIGILIVISLIFMNDTLGFISHALFTEPSLMSVLVGGGLSLLILAFLYVGGGLFKSSLEMVYIRYAYPPAHHDGVPSKWPQILILGLFPWIFAVGMGLLNDAYFDLKDEIVVTLLLPFLAVPLYFAKNFKVDWISVLLASAFWLAVGGVGFWVFG